MSPERKVALLEAGFPSLGIRALEEMPKEAAHWLENTERIERDKRKTSFIPGYCVRRGRIYAE